MKILYGNQMGYQSLNIWRLFGNIKIFMKQKNEKRVEHWKSMSIYTEELCK